MSYKLLILGSGQLGTELIQLAKDGAYTYHKLDPLGKGIQLDVTNFDLVEDLIIKLSPDIIINTVALTDVDKCEKERNLAIKINAEAVKHIVRASRVSSSYLVHISTDYVFDGRKGLYKEDDEPNPINYYGLSKLLGETYALSYDDSIIIRTSGIFRHKGFLATVVKQLKSGKQVYAYKGYYSPISAKLLAESIVKVIELRKTGIINIAGERISRYEIAIKIAKMLNLNINDIHEIDKGIDWLAARPFDSSLDISKAKALLGFDFYSIENNIRYLIV